MRQGQALHRTLAKPTIQSILFKTHCSIDKFLDNLEILFLNYYKVLLKEIPHKFLEKDG